MPDITTEGLQKPLGTEAVTRAAYNANIDLINAALVKKANKDGTLQIGLNAEKVGGKLASDFALATAYTAADVLTKLLTVDGAGSGLDADKLDAKESGVAQGQILAIPTGGVAGQALLLQANGTLAWGDAAMETKQMKYSDFEAVLTVQSQWYTALSVAGKGKLFEVIGGTSNNNLAGMEIRVTLDGVVQPPIVYGTGGASYPRCSLSSAGNSYGLNWSGSALFNTSLLVEIRCISAASRAGEVSTNYGLV